MNEGTAVKQRRGRSARNCQHHWIIETPHGATSRGSCRLCGTTRRFPNAAEDALWESNAAGLGRWSTRRGVARPKEISLPDSEQIEF